MRRSAIPTLIMLETPKLHIQHAFQPALAAVGAVLCDHCPNELVLNEIWEMADVRLRRNGMGHSRMSTLALCTQAAVGDGNHLGPYAAGALPAGDLGCAARPLEHLCHGCCSGAGFAALVEHAALAAGRWSYSEHMLVVWRLAPSGRYSK
jgi:hypothetical protein